MNICLPVEWLAVDSEESMAAVLSSQHSSKAVARFTKNINKPQLRQLVSLPNYSKRACLSILDCSLLNRSFFNAATLSVSYYYDVILQTGNRFGAGTDAKVFLKLHGEKGSTEEILLPSKKGDLERGMVNRYKVNAKDLGNLRKVDVRHDNTGLGPAWFLDKVTVRDHGGNRYIFDCGQWLLKRSGEENLQVELGLSEQNLDQLSSYKGINLDYARLTEEEHLDAVEEKVHKNLSSVLQGIIQSHDDSMSENLLKESDGSNDGHSEHTFSPSNDLMLPSARLLVEAFGLANANIPSTGPKGHLLKGDVLNYVSVNNISRLKQQQQHKFDALTAKSVIEQPKTPVSKSKAADFKQAAKRSEARTPKVTGVASGDYNDKPLTPEEMITSQQYMLSKSTIPHVYSTYECNIENLTKLQNDYLEKGITVSMDAFLLKATAFALNSVPEMNVSYTDAGTVTTLPSVDISTTLISGNSIVRPVFKNVDSMRLKEITDKIQNIQNSPSSEKPESSDTVSFSIINLGPFDVAEFSDVITPPQVCVMSVGKSQLSLSPISSTSDMKMSESVKITLSFDGRLIDETTASSFMKKFTQCIENPSAFIG
eukprot:gene13984-15442_t